jgi:uncharacterized protein YjbI with pentapeptide repeats
MEASWKMIDGADTTTILESRTMNDATPKKPKIKADNNPWYLLATLYGEPTGDDDALQVRNRTAWNRYMAATLTDAQRASLIEKGRLKSEDLTPFSPEELSAIEKAFWERREQAGSIVSVNLPPPEQIDFSNVEFDHHFRAGGFFFPGSFFLPGSDSGFKGATFSNYADFEGATFYRDAVFEGATFVKYTSFKGATFLDFAHFEGATFDYADFESTTFSNYARFGSVTFSNYISFMGATFSNYADFGDANFSKHANFTGATFSNYAFFINVDMRGPTSFQSATFSSFPPAFFGAKLHEGTVWRGVKWPNRPKNAGNAGEFVDAYERLKLEMDRLKKHEDELHFFALEMQSRRILHGDWKPVSELTFFGRTIPVPSLKIPEIPITPKPRKLFGRHFSLPPFKIWARTVTLHWPASGLPIALYGLLSDYGRSYMRPFYGLLVTAAVGILAFLPYFGLRKFKKAIGLSIANTLGVLGFRKDFVDPHILESLPGSLKVFSAMQTVAGIVLLFLFGLAIRNRFRMK